MLIFGNGPGLGAGVNPFTQTSFSVPGTTPNTEPAQVFVEPTGAYGYTRQGLDTIKGNWYRELDRRVAVMKDELIKLFAGTLPPAEAIFTNPVERCRFAAQRGFTDTLYPIGVATELGVQFIPSMFQAEDEATFTQSYTPDKDQRFLADWAIYEESQRQLVNYFIHPGEFVRVDFPGIGESYRMATNADLFVDLIDPSRGLQRAVDAADAKFGHPSLNDLLKVVDKNGAHVFTVARENVQATGYDFPAGFTTTPIPATDDELTKPGGLKAYYARGGFVLDRRVLDGRLPVHQTDLRFGKGYFLCGDTPAMEVVTLSGENAYGYNVYVTVGDPNYTMRIEAIDAPWYSEAYGAIKDTILAVARLFCGNKAQIAAGVSKVPPVTPVTAIVTVAVVAAAHLCGDPDAPLPPSATTPPPIPPPPPPISLGLAGWQIAALAILGASVGYVLARPKKPA
jgi:hypothetical protein